MYIFLRTLFALMGVVLTGMLVLAIAWDLQQMDPDNGHYRKGEGFARAGEAVSLEMLDATPEGFAKRGLLLDLLLECRSGALSLEFFRWRLDIGKISEARVQLHQPQKTCRKRGLQTLF